MQLWVRQWETRSVRSVKKCKGWLFRVAYTQYSAGWASAGSCRMSTPV